METETNMQTIRLQGIGHYNAKPAGELVEGDIVVWNYGYPTLVRSVEPRGKTMVAVTYESQDGTEYVRRHRRSFLVGLALKDTWANPRKGGE